MVYIRLHNEIFKKTNKWDLTGFNYSTLHIMQDFDNGCCAKCPFCSQSIDKSLLVDNEFIKYPLDKFIKNIDIEKSDDSSSSVELEIFTLERITHPN
jgi:hypothetical protein